MSSEPGWIALPMSSSTCDHTRAGDRSTERPQHDIIVQRSMKTMAGNDKINILLVDDLPEKLLVLETILQDLGENLVKATSGEEALRHVLQDDFAVVLLDVNMPGMDGYETAGYIRRRKKSAHTPIIFITAYADEMHTAAGYSLGAVDYIFTPVVPEILRTKVKVFVDLFRMTELAKRQADERVALAREQAARAAAEEATRRSTFLAQAGNILSSSLDMQATLQALARLVVPYLADVSVVAAAEDHSLTNRFELAWASETGEVLTDPLKNLAALPEGLSAAIEQTLQTGKTTLPEDLGPWPPVQESQAQNGQRQRRPTWRAQSALVLPLRARGRTLGALALAFHLRRHGPAELALSLDLVGRAAIALDNARLYQNIQEADRRKNEFLVMLAHELRNPLAPIRNAVQVLRLMAPSEPMLLEARNMIDRQVTHMARLIDDLLDMSRLARGKILLRMQNVDVVDLVKATTEDYRRVFESTGLALNVVLPQEPIHVSGDPTRLAQIVGNVLHNANKFTDAGGQVEIRVCPDEGEHVQIAVRDTGIGMEPAMLARVFETFSQADNSLDRSRGGLGLGLALVKGLVELHGGQVRAHSPGPGQGTEVSIRLPRQQAPREEKAAAEIQPLHRQSRRILIIEDNHDAAESLRTLFVLTGYEVEVAFAGPTGVEMARRFRPEIVLCDIGLPGGMDGYAVAQTLRNDPGFMQTRLIALTGYGQEQDQKRSLQAGFDAHLTKPVDFPDLERLLSEMTSPAVS